MILLVVARLGDRDRVLIRALENGVHVLPVRITESRRLNGTHARGHALGVEVREHQDLFAFGKGGLLLVGGDLNF